MRFRPPIPLACAWFLGLAALSAMPTRAPAQADITPIVPIGQPVPHPIAHAHKWGCCARLPAVPRTYSYQYDLWLNWPRHTKYIGPDGRKYWQTTVRGLPLGVPGPSY
jgi:hypothetical protein